MGLSLVKRTSRRPLAGMGIFNISALRPLLLDSNGAGGYHLLLCLSDEVPARIVHEFVTEVVQNYAEYGLRKAPTYIPASPK